MHTNATKVSLLAGFLLALVLAIPATSQNPPPLDEGQMGLILGTNITRDEFRARANAQLTAIALNAETYYLIHGDYPESFYTLYNSSCWNLDPNNIFTGEIIDAIYFEPLPTDLITNNDTGLPFGLDPPQIPIQTPAQPPAGNGGDGPGEGQAPPPPPGFPTNMTPNPIAVMKVDPGKVQNITPGNIYYRAFANTLQLVVYAPDNTYYELFNDSPNLFWQRKLNLEIGVSHWSEDVLAGQVLYFTGTMLPQLYNHVMFMADLEVLPGSALGLYGVDARLQMAEELGITILNPYSKRPIQLANDYQLGSFLELNPSAPIPLYLCLVADRILSREQILEAQRAEAQAARSGKKTRSPRRPAMGGSR